MAEYVYVLKGLTKIVPGGRVVLRDLWLSFLPGAKIGVVGPNGAGKSTLLRIMAGLDRDFEGEAFPGKGVRVGYLPQEPELDPALDVRGNILAGLGEAVELLRRYEELTAALAEPLDEDTMQRTLDELARVQDAIEAAGAWELDRTIEIAMDALRVPEGDRDVGTLSGGEVRRVALCRLLLQRPDLLLLDEPTNHLDAETVAWLQQHLADYPGTVVCVTHDRYFLDEVAGWILELDRGRGYPFEGNYSAWLAHREQRLAQEQQQQREELEQLRRELEWVRQGRKGRAQVTKARRRNYEELASRQRETRISRPVITIPDGPRLGDVVVRAEGLTKAYGDRLLFEDLSFDLPPGGIVGVIGPNGAGKTTLLRLIVGEEQPDAGTLEVGDTVVVSYVDQSRADLDAERTVFEEISGGAEWISVGDRELNARAYVAAFGFRGADQQKRVGECSGGERNRIHLAKLLQTGGNLLLLDEPTNDLDVDTLRALEEALLDFAGCAVIVSHDRWFLDRVATHILAFEGDSRVVWFPGTYSEYEEDFRRRVGVDWHPTRIRYKPLTRRT